MKNRYCKLLVMVIVLAAVSLACSVTGTKIADENAVLPPEKAGVTASGKHTDGETSSSSKASSSDFPLPDAKIEGLTELAPGQINYQVAMKLGDVVSFYKDAFTKQGLAERKIVTVQSDTTFSMVFDGDPSGKAIVIQGLAIEDKVNVNLRFEDI